MRPDEYLRYDALDLARLVRDGETTPSALLDAALALCDEHDPRLNAVVIRFDDRARRALEELPAAAPFRGVPFLLKDLYAELEGTPLTNGSALFRDYVCDHDSELVARYRRAGLVIFGRTASPELGITTTTESAIFGKTRNPWALERSTGGSSGGAAAACAAGITPIAHASDGGGSIRIPASCCGLFGLKPTRGRVSAAPDKGEGWAGLSVNHAVSRSVRDSAALLDAVCGPAAGDPYWAPPPERPYLDETQRAPGRLRIAWTSRTFNGAETDAACVAALEDAVALCRELGHELTEAAPEIDPEQLAATGRLIVGANVYATLDKRAAELGRELREDAVEPLTWRTAIGAKPHPIWEYPRAVDSAHAIGRQVGRFFERYDVLLTPTMATPPLPLGAVALDQEDGEAFLRDLLKTIGFTQLMNVAGNPAMSVPLCWSEDGLPIGIQFAAAAAREDTLFRLAAQLEEARPWRERRPPV